MEVLKLLVEIWCERDEEMVGPCNTARLLVGCGGVWWIVDYGMLVTCLQDGARLQLQT